MGRRGIPEEIREAVLGRLGEVGLVDDVAFAELTVHAGHTHRGLGRHALHAELRHRGVAELVADEAVSRIRPEDEERRARELVRRRVRTSTSVPPEAVTLARRLIAILVRRGYSQELASRVVRDELGTDGWPGEIESEWT